MTKKPRNRVLLVAVFGLELGLLGWGIYVLFDLIDRGFKPVTIGQLAVMLGAMVLVYLMYLKKEKEHVEEQVVGEKFRTGALLDALPVAAMLLDGEGTVLAANSRAAQALGVDELELAGAAAGEAIGGELGQRLTGNAAGSFVAATGAGRSLRCTVTSVGGAASARLVILEPQTAPAAEKAPAAAQPQAQPAALAPSSACKGYLTDVASLLERTGNHLAMLSSAARASSPHESSRAAQLSGVALRLAQAARRIRLAREIELLAAGKLAASLVPTQFDFAELARAAAARMDSLCHAAGVELVVDVPGAPLAVRADRERMELVLRDLLEVALAMTAPGGQVTLRVSGGSGEVELSVTDSGCGMSRAEVEKLFSADGRPPVLEAYTGGVRDGLQVAKEIIEASGGQLWAESSPGRGTRSSLRLPMAEVPAAEGKPAQ